MKAKGESVMQKKSTFIIVVSVLLFVITFGVMVTDTNQRKAKAVPTSSTALSNQKIGWGIKRASNHQQPDVGSANQKIMDAYDAIYLGNKEKKQVYLTFDMGYEAGYTEKILAVLKENKVSATFFITAHYLNTQPELVKKMIDEGHIVGNHTVNHKSMPDLTEEQIKNEVMNFHTAIYQKFGYEMKYIRPPKGEYSERTIAYTNQLGYKTVMWSLAYDDWDENKQGREEYGKKKVIDNIHPGAVILLHGTSKDNSNILDGCIKEVKKMGYEWKSLDEFER